MDREDAVAAIAEILHRYVHPTYSTATWCTFCYAIAHKVVCDVAEEEEGHVS